MVIGFLAESTAAARGDGDLMTDAITSFLSTIAGALVGGACAVYGAIRAVERTSEGLEKSEIRRQRVMCLVNLTACRFALAQNQIGIPQPPYEMRLRFLAELNKVPALWSDSEDIMRNLRDYDAQPSTERLVVVLRSLAATTPLRFDKLADTDIVRVFN
jgi:hypothetical protein